jgi:hypothetical protein
MILLTNNVRMTVYFQNNIHSLPMSLFHHQTFAYRFSDGDVILQDLLILNRSKLRLERSQIFLLLDRAEPFLTSPKSTK